MNKDKLIAMVRNPKKYAKPAAADLPEMPSGKPSRMVTVLTVVVLCLVFLSLLIIFSIKQKAENIPSFMDEKVLEGLVVDRTFSPYTAKQYVEVPEGAERNVKVKELGSTLPVISRYNFRTLNKENYKVIGAAPWALSINVVANADDPDLLRYLLNQDDMIQAFLKRSDVAVLLEDPVALARVAGDEAALQKFFAQEAAQQVLASDALIEAFAGSRLMAYLLTSTAVKHYRDNPAAAAQLLRSNATLSSLKQNPAIRKAVSENYYLKAIAPTLLK